MSNVDKRGSFEVYKFTTLHVVCDDDTFGSLEVYTLCDADKFGGLQVYMFCATTISLEVYKFTHGV